MTTMHYNLEDVNKIKLKGINFELPENTQQLIKDLSKLVGSPDYIKTPTFQKKKRDSNEPDWDLIKQFKPTAKVERTDNEEIIQDIKRAMNKVTDKNYDTLFSEIVEGLTKLKHTNELNLILDIIFNLASSNRFYSKVYAVLYKDLMEQFPEIFTLRIHKELQEYVTRFTKIKNIDANEDYEAFCDNNKSNEQNKAITEFFSNLMVLGIVSDDNIQAVFNQLLDLVNTYISDENHKHTIVELSENIFILLKCCAETLHENGHLSPMISKIDTISKYKVSEYPGLSNKSLFKFMDITDIKV